MVPGPAPGTRGAESAPGRPSGPETQADLAPGLAVLPSGDPFPGHGAGRECPFPLRAPPARVRVREHPQGPDAGCGWALCPSAPPPLPGELPGGGGPDDGGREMVLPTLVPGPVPLGLRSHHPCRGARPGDSLREALSGLPGEGAGLHSPASPLPSAWWAGVLGERQGLGIRVQSPTLPAQQGVAGLPRDSRWIRSALGQGRLDGSGVKVGARVPGGAGLRRRGFHRRLEGSQDGPVPWGCPVVRRMPGRSACGDTCSLRPCSA